MNKPLFAQIAVLIILAGVFSYVLVKTDAYEGIKNAIVTTVCLSCIKMDQVSKTSFNFETANGEPNPTFVIENLTKGPVFLAFRQDVCTACDDMDPILQKVFNVQYEKYGLFYQNVDFSGTNISFFHINTDQVTSGEFRESFSIYDSSHVNGVPMFVMITLGNNNGLVEPCYSTAYGRLGFDDNGHRENFIRNMISMGVDLYNQNILNYPN